MDDFRFDIILTVWNRKRYTERTIASLIESGAIRDCERFIIVDNRSTEEGMAELLNDIYTHMPEVSGKVWLLRRGNNYGWGSAVNDALGLSRAPYLLLTNNDVEYKPGFHRRAAETFFAHSLSSNHQKGIGILGVWRHTAHGFVVGGVQAPYFREMDNVPAVGWFLPKGAMEEVGMLPEHGPCFTKGGNGEDTAYVGRMKEAGYLVGVPGEDIAVHIDGY